MNHFAVYASATGHIAYIGHSDASVFDILDRLPIAPGQSIALCDAGIDQRQWRVVAGAVVPRDAMTLAVSKTTIVADGADEAVISGLPDPCVVAIAGAATWGPEQVTGGSLTLTASVAGAYRVSVTAEPAFVAGEVTIHAA